MKIFPLSILSLSILTTGSISAQEEPVEKIAQGCVGIPSQAEQLRRWWQALLARCVEAAAELTSNRRERDLLKRRAAEAGAAAVSS